MGQNPNRVRYKVALDVLRLLRAVETDTLAGRLAFLLTSDIADGCAAEAIAQFPSLFGDTNAEGGFFKVADRRSVGTKRRVDAISEAPVCEDDQPLPYSKLLLPAVWLNLPLRYSDDIDEPASLAVARGTLA
jgi:hypothetical protein